MRTIAAVARRYYLVAAWAVIGLLLVAANLAGGAEPPVVVRFARRTLAILWAMSWVALPFSLRGFGVQYWREVGAYFLGPVAYVCIALFLFITGLGFHWANLGGRLTTLLYVHQVSVFTMVLVVPLLTMRLLAAEKGSGTFETLMTDPITDLEVVLAKFCAAVTVLAALLVPQSAYVVIIARFSSPDLSAILCGYLGLVCIGALMVSVGLFVSSLVKSQAVAAIISVVVLFAFVFLVEGIVPDIGLPADLRDFLVEYLSMPYHLRHFFIEGLLSTRILVFYLSTIALFLSFTVRAVESRKWR